MFQPAKLVQGERKCKLICNLLGLHIITCDTQQ